MLDQLHIHLPFFNIDYNWFAFKKNYVTLYEKVGGEKGFIIYLNLFKFLRSNSNRTDEDFIIYTSIKEIYDNCNQGRRIITYDQIIDTLIILCKEKIITSYRVKDWRYFKETKRDYNQLLIFKLHQTEMNVDKKTFYIHTRFNILEYILEKGYSYRHFIIYLLLKSKLSWNEKKAYPSINTIAEWLQIGDRFVSRCITDLNLLGLIASYRRKRTDYDGYKFEHKVLIYLEQLEEFKKEHRQAHEYFIKKENKKN